MKTYNAIDIAKRFLGLAQPEGIGLTNMKPQKLVFFSQVVALKMFGQPVHGNASLAWDFGPVVRELHDIIHDLAALRTNKQIFLSDAGVCAAFDGAAKIDDIEVLGLTRAVWNKFKGWTAYQLSALTHRHGFPWAVVYSRTPYAVITPEIMRKHGFGNA